MALKHLTTGEMVGVTETWRQYDHDDRQALVTVAALVGIMPLVDEAHDELLETQDEAESEDELQGSEPETSAAVDFRHDSLVRGTSHTLQGHMHFALAYGLHEEADDINELHDKVLPYGLTVVNFSYREEGGQARLLSSRLTNSDQLLLQSIPTKHGSLMKQVDTWIVTGKKLIELENERLREQNEETPAGRQHRARFQWIRAIQSVRSVVQLSRTDNPEVLAVLANLAAVERIADIRARLAQEADAASDASQDEPGSDSPDAVADPSPSPMEPTADDSTAPDSTR